MTAPPPKNFTALADAWDDPTAFARELAAYYAELEEAGFRTPTPDITTSRRATA